MWNGDFNERYYFNKQGGKALHIYMRFENLQENYNDFCRKIKYPVEELPKLKSEYRKDPRHYSEYYNEDTKAYVARMCAKQINEFNYRFETLG